MKIVINDKLIKRNKTIGQVATFASLAILALGLVFAFSKDLSKILYSYIALIIGFILSQIGMYFTSRFGRTPRFDEILANAFEKLRHEYTFYVHSTPLPMVLVGPCRIWVPIPILAGGKIAYENGKWRQIGGNFMMKLFSQEGLGKPDKEAFNNTQTIQKYLELNGVPIEEQPPIQHVMVAIMKNTELGELSEAPIPVVQLEELKRYIRRMDRDDCPSPLTEESKLQITSAFDEYNQKRS